jgi:tRNA(Ile)-lysidine synthase TilS/MesJ
MDTTDLEITFDQNGYCGHCIEFLSKRAKYKYQGQESDKSLDRIVEDIKRAGKGKAYDCVIGVSGGSDSSYLASLALR